MNATSHGRTDATTRVRHGGARRRDQRGITLVELLLGFVVLALIGVMVTAITLTGVLSTSGDATDREESAAVADVAAMWFGRDVQGASSLSATPCGSGGTALVTFASSTDADRRVTYRSIPGDDGATLVRVGCSGGSTTGSSVLAEGLEVAPTVACSPGPCTTGFPPPRTVTLRAGRTGRFPFDLDGTRRTIATATAAPTSTARFLATGATSPLTISGNGALVINGNAYLNSSAANAVSISGNGRLTATGSLTLRQGAGCSGCNAGNTTPFPPATTAAAVPDPLAYLPAPSEAGMPAGSCTSTRCRPGLYTSRLSLSSSRVFDPGVYVLRRGISVTGQAAITGDGVFLYNGCGAGAPSSCTSSQSSFSFSGQGQVRLTPPTSGTYQGVLLFQSRTNATNGSLSGGSAASSYSGVVYVPNATVSFSGGSGLAVGSVIGRSFGLSGNGTVTVG